MSIKIAPSILSADYARLADGIAEAEAGGADWIHVDVMDGHFVPNLTIGPPVIAALRRVTSLPLDVHLMVERPHALLEAVAGAGADYITIHQEATVHLHRTVQRIRELGARPGVSLNPGTPLSSIDEVLRYVDLVLVMTVNPGFGGQDYIPTSTAKIAGLRRHLDELSLWGIELEVDGGIAPDTAAEVAAAGASVLVAGAAIFNEQGTVAENIAQLRRHAGAAARESTG
jgi:ribulose-phosphate 3-epimerase